MNPIPSTSAAACPDDFMSNPLRRRIPISTAASAASTAASEETQKKAATLKTVSFIIRELAATKTPGNRPIHKIVHLSNNNQDWEFQIRSTAIGNHAPFATQIVEGMSTHVDLSKIPLPKFILRKHAAAVKGCKTLADCYNAYTATLVFEKPATNEIPARNFVSLLPVKESTGKAPFHPTIDLMVKGEANCAIVFDDAGTQFGYMKFANLSGKQYFGNNALLLQGLDPTSGEGISGPVTMDWAINPITDEVMKEISEKNAAKADAIAKNALNILLYKLKKGYKNFFPLSLASANVGVTTGGEENNQNHKVIKDQELWTSIPDSMVYIRVSGIAARTIIGNGNTAKTPEEILKLADQVAEANDKLMQSLS